MRWSIIRLIWVRELRDQLRDRRTIMMIAVLPILLYPVAGFGFMQLASSFINKPSSVEIHGAEYLPQPPSGAAAAVAVGPGALPRDHVLSFPPLLEGDSENPRFPSAYFELSAEARTLKLLTKPAPEGADTSEAVLKQIDRSQLVNRQIDLIVVVPPGFRDDLEAGRQPTLFLLARPGDDRSKLVYTRVNDILKRWQGKLADVRLARRGLPTSYDEPFEVRDPDKEDKSAKELASDELFGILVRVFPFILVMWSLAGALYPAVDLCAGEKERGTMETLLISPASREEIVWGKFLTIWVFSSATALLNLLSMGLTTMQFGSALKIDAFHPIALLWGVLLLLPLSAFFSAVCLAVGAYARSSKEGQYYLMPLFLVTMPLIFLTLAPDVKLNPFYSMVPITGVALLLQELMRADFQRMRELLVYFIPVLGPMTIYSWLALRWAIEQFKREEVLFREAERLDIALWLRNLFREKELLPTTGEALFCFALVMGLSRLSLSFGDGLTAMTVRYLAFVATPPLFMALLLTKWPRLGLGLRLPPWWAWPAAAVLAVLLFFPGMEYARYINQIPAVKAAVEQYQNSQRGGPELGWQQLAVAALGALAEELAFRGFILGGLLRRFRPWMAVFVSSFLFGLSQMNVFQFVPHFVAGVAMGFLVVRTGSVLPAMLCHLVFNIFVAGPIAFPEEFAHLRYANVGVEGSPVLTVLAVGGLAGAVALLAGIWWLTPAPAVPTAASEKT